ncbi:bacterioferritin-associated ferredoxin [Bordetella sp. 15P40C-2]|uniref:(2Fe-2S)-binding protein n=1 Tax=unclassified Bordetella TaxID=2630031 RepID=UPI0013665B7C|nr:MULTISPECIES: (2Fe-2S)-binding protein [unclassified Bordetella]
MYICICNAVNERQIHAAVDAGATTLDDLQFELGVATCCGCCAEMAQEYLPGGRCSKVCHSQSVAVELDAAPGLEAGQAANSFPIALVAAA